MGLCACVGILALGLLVLLRGGRSSIALPLALLCIDMFVWNFASLAEDVSGNTTWGTLDVVFSPFTPPLALHVILAFVGRMQSLRWLLVLAYTAFGASSLLAASAFFCALGRAWILSGTRNMVFLGLWIPLVVLEVALLVRHWRRTPLYEEQWRARLILAAVVVGAVLGSTEMWDDFVDIPALGHLGALGSMTIIAAVVLRFRLFGHELSSSVTIYSGALAAAGTVGYLAVFRWFGTNFAAFIVGTAALTLALLVAARDAATSVATRRERLRQLAHLGRFSAQMAHDLKNPLSALKGALQLLFEEKARGRPLEGKIEYLHLVEEQADRIEAVIDRYQRLSKVEPVLGPVPVDELVERVLSQAALSRGGGAIRFERHLGEGLPALLGDRDLIQGALENLVRNACEAMPAGGTLSISAAFARKDSGGGEIRIRVEDQGEGIDARQMERVFDEFYTTKAQGSGLGLPFVRRVVEAHGGEVRIESTLSRGTAVEVLLPAAPSGERERTRT
jgi:two-component system, NtrC family, sensor histidine kinase HydH